MNYPDDYINQVICGDALETLKTMPDGVIQTCITSPPYWGLRDYGVDGQIGLEPTPEEYVAKIVGVFEEVRRVLRDDGTLWLNLGDSYAANRGSGAKSVGKKQSTNVGANLERLTVPAGFKEKDLIGIPWLVAFALRNAGWYLRQDIIWHKPNPMPESVTDRCTKAHEYIFLLSKRGTYYCDMDAIREPVTESTVLRLSQDVTSQAGSNRAHAGAKTNGPMKAVGKISNRDKFSRTGPVSNHVLPNQSSAQHRPDREDNPPNGMRNKRSVWTVATQPFKEAHFATFPIKLIEPCILAGSREGDIVLDPFMGSGTVALRSKELGRKHIGSELNPEYIKIAEDRLRQEELF